MFESLVDNESIYSEFPVLIKMTVTGEEFTINHPDDLPNKQAFRIIETNS